MPSRNPHESLFVADGFSFGGRGSGDDGGGGGDNGGVGGDDGVVHGGVLLVGVGVDGVDGFDSGGEGGVDAHGVFLSWSCCLVSIGRGINTY